MKKSFEDIDLEKEQLDFEADALLRSKGWQYLCDYPGSYWLWTRKLKDGRTIAVPKSIAIGVQNWFDAYGEERPKRKTK